MHCDTVVVYLKRSYFKYSPGYEIELIKWILGYWMTASPTPANVGSSIQCFGTTNNSLPVPSASVRDDMLITYVDKKVDTSCTYYIPANYVGTERKARQWIFPQIPDWSTAKEIGNIGV